MIAGFQESLVQIVVQFVLELACLVGNNLALFFEFQTSLSAISSVIFIHPFDIIPFLIILCKKFDIFIDGTGHEPALGDFCGSVSKVFERGLYFSADFIVQSRSFEVIQVVEEIGKDVLAEVIEGPECRSSRIVHSAWLGLLDAFFLCLDAILALQEGVEKSIA